MMKIQNNTVVTLSYTLSDHQTGNKIEETSNENPIVFLFGVGSILPTFEENIFGKTIGDTFDFQLSSDQAYGKSNEDQVALLPIDIFMNENGEFDKEAFKIDSIIPMSDSEGNQLRGRILEILPDYIKMDFNHPLAGKDLRFQGSIIHVREAQQDEIDHGHVHGEGGHHH